MAGCARWVALIAVGCAFVCGESAATDELSAQALFAWRPFLSHAHSHNDYQQMRPLLDALGAGVSSVEADLYFDRGTIRVAHDRGKWRGDFETLYLQPLNARWEANALGREATGRFLLWLDLKEPTPSLRASLETMLMRYPMTRMADPARTRVQIILTGNETAKRAFAAETASPLVTRDSNIFSDTDEEGSDRWRWYALDWSKIGTWTGEGAMPPHERDHL
ncbi:MAG TPA: hypothetical protein VFV83_08580, partial [Chthoniobacteraceae bacterium]|nr:hypothetical protein [Chthoniobacteraceae bacterium]